MWVRYCGRPENVVGGGQYAKLLSESREQALDRMLVEAESLGANAVISVQFETCNYGGAAEMMPMGPRLS